MKTPSLLAFLTVIGAGLVQAQDLPEASPNHCFAKVLVPADFEVRTEKVLIQPRAATLSVRPAEYETVSEDVVLREESVEYKIVPAKYEVREKRILLSPEKKVSTIVAPKFKTIQQRVLVTPAHYIWKPGRGPFEKLDRATGEILCRVEVPAVYKMVEKRVVETPAKITTKTIPAKYKTVRTKVVVRQAEVIKKVIPAQTRTFQVERLRAGEEMVPGEISEVYRTVETNIKTGEEKFEYRPILCETNTTPDVVRRIQTALKNAGFYRGTIDGNIGPGTLSAVSDFQHENNLEVGNLTLRTLEALGVKL